MRAQRGGGGFDGVGRMGIIDIDRRADAGDDGAFEAAAHGLNTRQIAERCHDIAAGGDDQTRRHQRIGRLIGTDQRQCDLVHLARSFDHQRLAKRCRLPRYKPQRVTGRADREQPHAARRGGSDHPGRPFAVIGPHHRRACCIDDVGEQPQLGSEIGLHRAVIIQMVARQVGERCCGYGQAFGAILVKPVAGGFKAGMGDAFALQPGHVGEERHHIGRRQPRRHLFTGRGDAQRADAGGDMTGLAPELTGQFGGRCFAVGAGNRHGNGWEWRKKLRRGVREHGARFVGMNGKGARHRYAGAGDNGDGAGGDGGGNEVFTIDARAAERAEHRAGRNLAMIKRKAGDDRRAPASKKAPQTHRYSLGTSWMLASRPLTSISLSASGWTPRIGPMRSMIRVMAGATTMPAVLKP